MVPLFRLMQARIDGVNRVLREQITGIRVVRAFVREPAERARFGVANAELTDTALRAGRLMAFMFPIVLLVLNVSSVAVLWFGADRVDSGEMQVGSLTAFLSYLMQILMSIMMATFMVVLVPRAAVCAERITEVLDTDSSVVPPADAGHRAARAGDRRAPRRRRSATRAPSDPVLTDVSFRSGPGQMTAIIGSTGSGKTHPAIPACRGCSTRPAAASWSTASTCASSTRRCCTAWSAWCPQTAYLFTGTVAEQPALRPAGGRPTRSCGRRCASRRPRTSSPAMPDGPRGAGRAGRHERLGRPAAAARDRPRAGARSRRSTCSTTRSRRSTWPPTRGCGLRSGR